MANLKVERIKILFCILFLVEPAELWFSKQPQKAVKKALWDELSVTLPGLFGRKEKLPMTEIEAKKGGWKKTDDRKCDGHEIFRGNRYSYNKDYGMMLLFDSNGRIAGMQVGVSTSVAMVEQRKYMMPISRGRYLLTVYFIDPKIICNAPKRDDNGIGDRFLIQSGSNWKVTMNVPINQKDLGSSLWVKGKCVFSRGTFYWYNISNEMDCESMFPVYTVYSEGKLSAFGWTFKGHVNSVKFDHPDPMFASLAFETKTFPACIQNAKTRGSTLHINLRSAWPTCPLFG